MNKAELIKGLDMTIEGLSIIKSAISSETAEVSSDVNETITVGKFDVEQLKAMKYNDFKKLASDLGVKCTGTRDEIMERILALDVVIDTDGEAHAEEVEDTVEEEAVEESPKSDKSEKGKGKIKAKASKPAKDEFDEQAEEILEESDVDEVLEALSEVGVKATKKNVSEKLAHALREGLLSLDDEEEQEDTDTDEDTAGDFDSSKYDPNGYNNEEEMSDKRKQSIEALVVDINKLVKNGKLTEKEITAYLEDSVTEEDAELIGDDYSFEELVAFYTEFRKRMIDNDGVEHEPSDPYELGEHDMCCGHELKYTAKTKKYICEICGTEYEAE